MHRLPGIGFRPWAFWIPLAIAFSLFGSGCAMQPALVPCDLPCDEGDVQALLPSRAPADTLYQVSTLQALLEGVYDGDTRVATLLRHGNHGLGTFNGLDGEMVLLDGTAYRVRVDGSITAMPATACVPFANVAHVPPSAPDRDDSHAPLPADLTDLAALKAALDKYCPNSNLPYAIRVAGRFATVKTRSVPRQGKPYPKLAEVVKEQAIFEGQDLRGTIIGFRFPPSLRSLNVVGYHLHFLADDRSLGGHLLDCRLAEGRVVAARPLPRFHMVLPTDAAFARVGLDQDHGAAVHAVEADPADAAEPAAPPPAKAPTPTRGAE